ncbi:hypothetical protein EYF80_023077 [Liparis tanakae]|uniref:Uncharacterized protein n=1 Tax=Liparis tanakae TaxID=230148 RepID=A0A4Z2HLF4_9TELE|nr:hypothetical protein EYF80_023077 [Liparis tanakae]
MHLAEVILRGFWGRWSLPNTRSLNPGRTPSGWCDRPELSAPSCDKALTTSAIIQWFTCFVSLCALAVAASSLRCRRALWERTLPVSRAA